MNTKRISKAQIDKMLEACPFCNGKHTVDIDDGGVIFYHNSLFDYCPAQEQELPEDMTIEDFIKIWNTRSREDVLKARIKELEKEIKSRKFGYNPPPEKVEPPTTPPPPPPTANKAKRTYYVEE